MTNNELKQHVEGALDWEPSIDAKDVGVAVRSGRRDPAGQRALVPEILSYARKHAIDLIVIGRGRPAGDVQTNQLRSAIESVVRDAPCPVLVI